MTSAPIAELHSLTPELVKAGGEITAAFIAALVAISGWFIGHNLTRRREDRTKRLQIALEHCEKQIAEFYAPLNGLLTQLDTTAKILVEMVDKEPLKTAILQRLVYFKYFLPLHREIEKILKEKLHLLEGFEIPGSIILYQKHFASENIYWNTIQEDQSNAPEFLGRVLGRLGLKLKGDSAATSTQEKGDAVATSTREDQSNAPEKGDSAATSTQQDVVTTETAITAFPEQIHKDVRNGLKAVSKKYENCIRELRRPSKLDN